MSSQEVGKWVQEGAFVYQLKDGGLRHGKPTLCNHAHFRVYIDNRQFGSQEERDKAESLLATEILELIELGRAVKQSLKNNRNIINGVE